MTAFRGFPGGSVEKNPSARKHRRYRFNPRVRNILWRRKWQPTPWLERNSMARGAWWATDHGVTKESDTTEQL